MILILMLVLNIRRYVECMHSYGWICHSFGINNVLIHDVNNYIDSELKVREFKQPVTLKDLCLLKDIPQCFSIFGVHQFR